MLDSAKESKDKEETVEDAAEEGEGEGREEEDEWVHVDETDAGVLFACACEFITPAAVCAGTFELTTSGIRPQSYQCIRS
jgi:hypothetical protein